MLMTQELIEGEDFYYNEDGYIVFTAKFHLQRGECCGNGCKHCPYWPHLNPLRRRGLKNQCVLKLIMYQTL